MKSGNKGNGERVGAADALPRERRQPAVGSRRFRPSTGLLVATGQERRAPLRGPLTKQTASCCIARILVLAAEDPERAVVTYIADSTGGVAAESLVVISTMNGVRSPIVTFCRGTIGWPAAVIAAHGLKGFRAAAPGTCFSFKDLPGADPAGKTSGPGSSLSLLAETVAADAQKRPADVLKWLKEGAVFSAEEALRNGLIDSISANPVLPPRG